MSDTIELAAIRARDAGIGNDAAFHRTISQVYLDRRTLLRMLDEARDALFLAGVRLTTATTAALGYGVSCKRDEPPYSPTLEAIMELKADHKMALTKVSKERDEARAENERLRDQISQLKSALESAPIEIDEFTVLNLVTFVRRLARQLRKADPNNKPALDALSYLNRHGVTGDLLRSASEPKENAR